MDFYTEESIIMHILARSISLKHFNRWICFLQTCSVMWITIMFFISCLDSHSDGGGGGGGDIFILV